LLDNAQQVCLQLRMEAKRRALDEIATRQRVADEQRACAKSQSQFSTLLESCDGPIN
jgi:hypothetical protein